MFSHLKGNNLGVSCTATRDFTVIETEDASLGRVTTVLEDAVVAELGLVLAQGDTGDLAAIVLVCECTKGTPSTTNVEKTVIRLEVELRKEIRV